MSVGLYTYGSAAGVVRYIGYMPGTERHFTEATTPSLETVEGVLDQVASEMHLALAENGYTVSLAATVLADAPLAHAFLAQCNNLGCAARVLMTMPYEADPDSETRPNFAKLYKDQLAKIEGAGLGVLGLVQPSTAVGNLRMSNPGQFHSDGTTKKPLFWRDQFAPPGMTVDPDPIYYRT